ncbi:hypothetical protein PsorP6_003426 [Peronosclerospora sorghi]|uniref:Uncharacterized protein n=1 Tax=Peronosclerospora sorghi TaxID=230839 RepID=A0ACC0VK74_9STRA|nr:hypothetical protein PsorP6_003426 [Peronosclerospora sorghi]
MAEKDYNHLDAAPLPPPSPPPPPPQLLPEKSIAQKPKKRKDFREILALFHDETMDAAKVKRVWSSLYHTTLMESQEDLKRKQQVQHGVKRKKSGDLDHVLMSMRGTHSRGTLTQDQLKRARQSSTASTDSSESGKTGRLGGRFSKNVPKGLKFLQKFGGRT